VATSLQAQIDSKGHFDRSGVTLPYTIGHENAGWVQEIGSAVSNVAVGDTVIVHPLITCGLCRACRAGSDYVVGYGGNLNVPTIDIISNEINFIGNLVGSYNDLAELMTLTAQGKVKLHTVVYPLDAALDAIHDLDSGKLRGRGILVPQA